jgi:hypothetical protein
LLAVKGKIVGAEHDFGWPNVVQIDMDLPTRGKSDNLRGMHSYTKKLSGNRNAVPSSTLPRSFFEVTARDIAWIIGGMLLAYVMTLI